MGIRWTTNRPAPAKTAVEQNRAWIEKRRAAGESWRSIAEKLGVTRQSLQIWFDADKIDWQKKRETARASAQRKRRELGIEAGRPRTYQKLHEAVVKIEVLGELPPPDTRNLTQRFMGDPVYQRSALYKIRNPGNAR